MQVAPQSLIRFLMTATLSIIVANPTSADVPDTIPVQGRLFDLEGNPIEGPTDMIFSLYGSKDGDDIVWSEAYIDSELIDGYFSFNLGSNTAIDYPSVFDNPEIWLGITVESDEEMERYLLSAVPFAVESKWCEQLGGLTEESIFSTFVSATAPSAGIEATDISKWNTAYGWGDHASQGYLTASTETDPAFNASPASSVTDNNLSNWNTAYSWGNHASEGYLTSYTETDPVYEAAPAAGITAPHVSNWNTAYNWGNHASKGYLTSYTETDPVYKAAPAAGVTATHVSNWNTAYNWGNHATKGYLTSYTETDPAFSASPAAGVTNTNIVNWNNAYSWNNHALAGYLTSYTETDPVYDADPAAGIADTDIANWDEAYTWGDHAGLYANASHSHAAADLTSGTINNARVNWAAPSAVGSTTPAAGSFTSLSASNGLSVANGTINLKPSGNGGSSGWLLKSDGAGNASWGAAPAPTVTVVKQNNNYSIAPSDGLVVADNAYNYTLPSSAGAGAGKILYIYVTGGNTVTLAPAGSDTLWDSTGNSSVALAVSTGTFISDGVDNWYMVSH